MTRIRTEEGGELRFRRCAIADQIRIDVVGMLEHDAFGGQRDSLATAYVTVATLRRLADEMERVP